MKGTADESTPYRVFIRKGFHLGADALSNVKPNSRAVLFLRLTGGQLFECQQGHLMAWLGSKVCCTCVLAFGSSQQ